MLCYAADGANTVAATTTAGAIRPVLWRATVADLARAPGKAELVDGEIVDMPAAGDLPNSAAAAIWESLNQHRRRTRSGRAYTDNVGFLVDLPHRKSFSPDASWYTGPRAGMAYLQGAPIFAAEVRGQDDYGAAAEVAMARKRADYFAAGTLVVWDVDLQSDDSVVRVYRDGNPDQPAARYRRGELAEAEPAVPGWRMRVDDLFD
jgi:Uma2 family endonuclease